MVPKGVSIKNDSTVRSMNNFKSYSWFVRSSYLDRLSKIYIYLFLSVVELINPFRKIVINFIFSC